MKHYAVAELDVTDPGWVGRIAGSAGEFFLVAGEDSGGVARIDP